MPSLKATNSKFKSIIDSIPFNSTIENEELLALFRFHPDWEKWSVDSIYVRKEKYMGSYVMKVYKTGEDSKGQYVDTVGVKKCIRLFLGMPILENKRYKVREAARNVCSAYDLHYRARLGVRVGLDELDHHVPFAIIFDAWLEEMGLTEDDIEIERGGDNYYAGIFVDKRLKDEWFEFYQNFAVLRKLTKEEHKEKTRDDIKEISKKRKSY